MREEEVVTGIVLYATPVGEYDKRLVVLTKERGKITVFANGARRPKSSFCAASQSFVMGSFTVVAGHDAYTLTRVNVQEYFQDISFDIEKTCYASYFGELMSYYTREGDFCTNNLNLLYVTLKALVQGDMPYGLIRSVYELRLMDIEGQGVNAYNCVKCGSNADLNNFNATAGGLVCDDCIKRSAVIGGKNRRVSQGLVYTLQYILSAPFNRLYAFKLEEALAKELETIAREFTGTYIDKKFNSLDILETL
ncbi:MAG: DNA repair protein RecO [Wujia sp.]